MKTKHPSVKYIAWRSPEELHETSLHWISELKFIKDELCFLEELIENNTLQLISEKAFAKSKEIVNELSRKRKGFDPLFKKIINHHNKLVLLLDSIDQPIKEKQYKEDHQELMIKVCRYFDNYKETKKKIFDHIKTIMRQSKQKRLLS